MKTSIITFFLIASFNSFCQDSLKHRISIGLDFSFEAGVKQYPGISVRPKLLYGHGADKSDYVSVGGIFGIGVNAGIMLSSRFQLRAGVRWEVAPQGRAFAEHDTVAKFSKFNINSIVRYTCQLVDQVHR